MTKLPFLAAFVLLGTLLAAPVSAEAASRWEPPPQAQIRPGVQMWTAGGQCTGNFVFTDRAGQVYVGFAAHCAATGTSLDTDGCRTEPMPLGSRVRFARGGTPFTRGTTVGWGRLAYSSWEAMQRVGTRASNACLHNDFALVRLNRGAWSRVNPTVPFWGGPTGLRSAGTRVGDDVFSFGSSSLRGGAALLSPKQGVSTGTTGNGWSHLVYTATPGVPGDSGSGFLDEQGRAFGVLATVGVTGQNGVGHLRRELRFARRHSGIAGLRLVRGTEPFTPLL